MAIKKQITLKTNFNDDVVFDNAYIKVASISGNKDLLSARVDFYKSQNAVLLQSVDYAFVPNLGGANFIAQAYAHLKTLEDFAGAVDC